MSNTLRYEDKLGAVLVQVQKDLRQLRLGLQRIPASESPATTLKALDYALSKTENSVRKQTEEYLRTVTTRLLVLPSIENIPNRCLEIPKWEPVLDFFPKMHWQGEDILRTSNNNEPRSPLLMQLHYKPAHTKNRTTLNQKCGISLPDVHRKCRSIANDHNIILGPPQKLRACEPKSHWNMAEFKEDKRKAKSKLQKWETVPGFTDEKSEAKVLLTPRTPPPSATSKNMDRACVLQGTPAICEGSKVMEVVSAHVNHSKYQFTITNGRIDTKEEHFCHFRQSFSLCWSSVAYALEALEKLLRDFAVPLAKVSGERLVEFAHGWDSGWTKAPPVINLLSVLENSEEVLGLVLSPGQRYKGECGVEAAVIHIQSCWRGRVARKAYQLLCRRKWAAGTIAISWLMHTQMIRVREALQARRLRQLENYRCRAQNLAANWKHIQSSKRTIIHIPSLGYSQSRRLNVRGFDIRQNLQMNRLAEIRDPKVEVIFICPTHLGEDILDYYYSALLMGDGATDTAGNRTTATTSCVRPFVILTPEAVDYFPNHNLCLSTLLKHSPHTLKRIKNLIQGKEAYIVGGLAHVDDLAVADELGVPILGPEPAIAQLYSTKSGCRKIFIAAEVEVPPGQGGIFSLKQLHETLARLMTENSDVKRWLFKIDPEPEGCGTAFCDVQHLSCYNWALNKYHRCGLGMWETKEIQESVLIRYLEEIPQWLERYARPAHTSCYPNWTSFIETFLSQGGAVEAYPPSDTVTCVTVDLLLEPGGHVITLSCGDQLQGSCQFEAVGSTVPQTSVHPQTLDSICARVGQVCLQHHIVGHVSLDLATFMDLGTTEQKVWAVDLDLRYSDQLAMTQMLQMMTGGSLNHHSGCLDVPMHVQGKHCEQQIADKTPVIPRRAVLGGHLFHSNLSMLYHSVFLKMCRAHGIGFNIQRKCGTVFALYDSSERRSMGMITVSEDLQGALVTFAHNLSIIHGEISASKMQEETNFKVLIKNIKDLLQRKQRTVRSKPAA